MKTFEALEPVNKLLRWWQKCHGPHARASVHSWHEFIGAERSIVEQAGRYGLQSIWIHVSDGSVSIWRSVADMCLAIGFRLSETPEQVEILLVVGCERITVPDWCRFGDPLLLIWDAFGSMFVRDTMRFHFRDLQPLRDQHQLDSVSDRIRPLLLSSNKTLIQRPVTEQAFHLSATYGVIDNISRFFGVLRTQQQQHQHTSSSKNELNLRTFPNLSRVDLWIDTSAPLELSQGDWRRWVKLLDGWIDKQPSLSLLVCYCTTTTTTTTTSLHDTKQHRDLLKKLRHYVQRKLPLTHDWYQRPLHDLFTVHLSAVIWECIQADFWSSPTPGDDLYSDFLQTIECFWSATKKANAVVSDLGQLLASMNGFDPDMPCSLVFSLHPLFQEQLTRLSVC